MCSTAGIKSDLQISSPRHRLLPIDIMDQGVDVDRRMLDFLVGLDTEFSDLVDGSHLVRPRRPYLMVCRQRQSAAHQQVDTLLGLNVFCSVCIAGKSLPECFCTGQLGCDVRMLP